MRQTILIAAILPGLLASPALASILNGDFEATPITGWNQSSLAFDPNGIICAVLACGDGNGLAGPRSGLQWTFFGGNIDLNEIASLTQDALFLNQPSSLVFYLWIGSSGNGLSTDRLQVSVDGNALISFSGTDAVTSSYVPVTVDVSPYSDGLTHTVRFDFASAASATPVIMSVDDVSLAPNSVPEPASGWLLCGGLMAALGYAGIERIRSERARAITVAQSPRRLCR